MYCKPADHWSACAANVKKAIRETNDPVVALHAATEWGERYRRLYVANPNASWSATDQDRLEEAADALWEEAVGKYLDPASLALSLAIAKHFRTLSAMLEWIGKPQLLFFYALLAPSPIANDFVAARPENEDINKLLREKLPMGITATLDVHYPAFFDGCYQKVKGVLPLP